MVRQMAAACQHGAFGYGQHPSGFANLPDMSDAAQNLFAILGSDDPSITDVVTAAFPDDDRYALPSGDWLVAVATEQAAVVYQRLREAADRDVRMVVARVDRYYGFHDTAIWDWMEAKRSGRG